MIELIIEWFNRNFSNQQAAILLLVLLLFSVLIYFFGSLLIPVFAAVILAYLLDDIIVRLSAARMFNRQWSLILIFLSFIGFIVFIFVVILPPAISQSSVFLSKIPHYLSLVQSEIVRQLSDNAALLNPETVANISQKISAMISQFAENILSQTLIFIPNLLNGLIFAVLVPMLIWFLLKDKQHIFESINKHLTADHTLTRRVWNDVNQQLKNYIRGKFIEILLVGFTTYLGFVIFDLQFSLLLAVLVGFSVLIPYIGFAVVCIPVILVAFSQFGISPSLGYVIGVFIILQALDAYVLVPILFSRAIGMHPIVIIISILFFGGLWGFWGLFFAIPLAVLIKAVILVWPKTPKTIKQNQ